MLFNNYFFLDKYNTIINVKVLKILCKQKFYFLFLINKHQLKILTKLINIPLLFSSIV